MDGTAAATIDVVSPVYNEAESLPLVLADVPRPPVRRVVVRSLKAAPPLRCVEPSAKPWMAAGVDGPYTLALGRADTASYQRARFFCSVDGRILRIRPKKSKPHWAVMSATV